MVAFLVVAGLLVALVVVLLSYRLWRMPATIDADQAADQSIDALSVLRDQKRELDQEVEAGRITAEQREARLADLTRRVHDEGLVDSHAATPSRSNAAKPRRRIWLALVVALLVPVVAIPMYLLIGNPTALDPAMRMAATGPSGHGEMTEEQIRTLLDELKARLAANPGDLKGWMMLGRGLRIVNDFAGSAAAFEKANVLSPNDASLLADQADSLAMAQGKSLEGRPRELIQQALKADPRFPKALALAASAEFAQGKFEAAKGYWQRLLDTVPAESESANEVKAILAQLDARISGGMGKAMAGVGDAAGGSVGGAPMAPGGTQQQMPAGASAASAAAAPYSPKKASVAGISGTVKLSTSLAGKIAPGDALFIFARAVEGPRMPLAIIRTTAAELPKTFKLDDSQAMAGGPALSSVAQMRIEARVSKSGDAMPKSGDLRGESVIVTPGMDNVDVVIDRVVP